MPQPSAPAMGARIEIPTRPRFGRHLAVEVIAGEGVVLLGERSCVVLTGSLHERLAAVLDGRSTADDIVDRLGDEHAPEEVYYALLGLVEQGHVIDAAVSDDPDGVPNGSSPAAGTVDRDDRSDGVESFWDSLGDVTGARRRLADMPVSVFASSDDDRRAWVAELAAHGFRIDDSDGAGLTLVIAEDYLDPALAEWNRRALADGRRWLLCRPTGTRVWVGPLFVPGASACWECLSHRLARNHPVLGFLARRSGRVPSLPRTAAPWTRQAAVGVVVTQLARLIVDTAPRDLRERLTIFDTLTLQSTSHPVVRRPQCRACGEPTLYERRPGAELLLSRGGKRFTSDGGHRTVTPNETLDRLAHLIDPVTGVVPELRRLRVGDTPLHVYTSGPNGAHAHRDLTGLRAGLRRSSSGKGFTEPQARASALGEAIERYSAGHQGDEPRITATFQELGELAIHPSRCTLYSDAQYALRGPAGGVVPNDEWVPPRFDESARIEWSPLWSMTERRTRYLPTSMLYLGYRPGEGLVFSLGDSNGNAAGNTLEEAVLQGLMELVERDGTALWWYNRATRPAIDLDSVGAAGWNEVRDLYAALGRELWLLDVTTDLEVPTFVAVSRLSAGPREEILVGLGAHLDPDIAASRAVSEMSQMLAALESLRDGVGVNSTLAWWIERATLANQPYLVPASGSATQLDVYRHVAHEDLIDDVRWCQRVIEALGMELLVLDQTRPDIEVPVVKVVVPGLRHIRPRFAPGRLYDVPVRLGWLSGPTPEPELNPAPFFL